VWGDHHRSTVAWMSDRATERQRDRETERQRDRETHSDMGTLTLANDRW
jgi:hypothetical protein